MKYKKFLTYQEYIHHQVKKILTYNQFRKKLIKNTPSIKNRFRQELRAIKDIMTPGQKVLCLGARLGTEVLIFKELGYNESIGIDLTVKYVLKPKLVLVADFHYIPFKNQVFDNVYTNSMDHCIDLQKMFIEMIRVLKPNGTIILRPLVHQNPTGRFETCFWNSIQEIKEVAKLCNLQIIYDQLTPGFFQNHSLVFKIQ